MTARRAPAAAEDGPSIEIDSHDAPPADDQDQAAVPKEEADPFAPALEGTIGWAPQEAAEFLLAIWNSGYLLFGDEWLARREEFDWWSPAAAQLLNRAGIPPPSAGGASPLMIAVAQVGAGLSGVALKKATVFRDGPRAALTRGPIFRAMRRDQKPKGERPPAKQSPAQEPPAGGGFRFDSKVAQQFEQAGFKSELAGFGIGDAA